jgi:DNA repair exonuclease SbcCD ATPase subunit
MATVTTPRRPTSEQLRAQVASLSDELATAREAERRASEAVIQGRLQGGDREGLRAAHGAALAEVNELEAAVRRGREQLAEAEAQEAADAAAAEAARLKREYLEARKAEVDAVGRYEKALNKALAAYREAAAAGDNAHDAGRRLGRETSTALHARRRTLSHVTSASFHAVVQAPDHGLFLGDPKWRRPLMETFTGYLPDLPEEN